MDKERQQKIYELLKRGLKFAETGEELPAEWARELFPLERREYELVYYGKKSEEQILADTMAVPFQPVGTFGQNGVDWHNKLIFGDNLQAMKTLLQMKERGELVKRPAFGLFVLIRRLQRSRIFAVAKIKKHTKTKSLVQNF